MQSGLIINVQSRETIEPFEFHTKAKALLFLDISDYDNLLLSLVNRAVDDVERFTGIAIGVQIRRISYSVLTETVNVPYGPVLSVESISAGGSVDEDGRLTARWPVGGALLVKCGYDKDSIPGALANAVVQVIAEYSRLDPSIKADSWKDSVRRLRKFNWAS